MLLNQEIVKTVAKKLVAFGFGNVVIDPVMVSRTGAQLLDDDAIKTIRDVLIPLAAIATPNRYEAQILADMPIHTLDDMQTAAQKIHKLGARSVLVKGGGMTDDLKAVDVWFDGDRLEVLPDRILVYTDNGEKALERVAKLGLDPVTSLVRRSSLEDVFLRLTGRTLVD